MANTRKGGKMGAADRRRQIVPLYLKGHTQVELARQFGVNQGTISRDLSKIHDMWIDATIKDFDAVKAAELERVNQLERTYWDAWERSVTEQIKTRVQSGEKGTTQSIEKADYFGDPRFLKGVHDCIDTRCKILGVYKAAEKEHGLGVMGPVTLRVMYGINGLEEEED